MAGPIRRRRGARWAAPAFVVMTAAAAALGGCGGDDEPELLGVVREPALDVAGVRLPSADDGEPVTMAAEPGGVMLVYWGYTSCPDICPTTLSDLSVAVNDLPADLAERVSVAFATVDPDRDSAEVLGNYLASFFPDGVTLRTDDPDELARAAEAFGVQYEVAEHQPGDRVYDVAHTAVTYVVDDTGSVVVEWPFGFAVDDIASDLTTLLDEEPT